MGGVEESGGEVTIRDLLITNENEDNAKATIGTTVLTEGEILDDGRLKLGSLGLQDLELTSDDGGMSLNNLKVTELLLPSAEEVAANKSPVGPGYRSLEINTVQIRDEDGKVADVDKIMSSIDSMDGDLPTSGSFSISGAKIDVKQIEIRGSQGADRPRLRDPVHEYYRFRKNGTRKPQRWSFRN
ncbi:hypothetical protein QW131_06300 [Roseibium salinum]|nr:hypothetical protein [Roseibium salinum]